MPKISILVADDHPIVRDGLIAVLRTQADFDVVGEAGNGRQVVEQYARLMPDIVLLDLEMPEMDGVEALQELHRRFTKVRAIAFTAFDTDERIWGAVRAGANGYLLKGASREELFRAIRIVYGGGSLLEPVVATKLLHQMSHSAATPELPEPLSAREQEVLNLMSAGCKIKRLPASSLSPSARLNFTSVRFWVSWCGQPHRGGHRGGAARACRFG
ncbi:MAG: response regulator transcription factor [Caldilineaceae bacterium]